MIVEETKSGIMIRPWVVRVISYLEGLGITGGLWLEIRMEEDTEE